MQHKILYSDNFVLINNLLLSRHYPINTLNAKEWKLLLYIEAHAHYKFGNTNRGHFDFNRYCSCSLTEYKKMIHRLQEMGFIQVYRHPLPSKFSTITLMMTPLYDPRTQQTYIEFPAIKNGEFIRISKVHFTMVPQNVLIKAISNESFTISHNRALLKLYRYNMWGLVQGIDSNALRYEDNKMVVNPRLPFDLFMDTEEFEYIVEELINAGYFIRQPAKITREKFDHEERYRLALDDKAVSAKPVDMLIPRYQYDEERKAG